jgi:hypothetical protein
MIRQLHPASVIALIVVTAACGSDDASTTELTTVVPAITTSPPVEFELPGDPDTVVLQLESGVNQPDPLAVSTGYPIFTLYADGRLIVKDPDAESGALPPLVAARLAPEGVNALVELAIASGALDPLDSYGSPPIADADGLGFVVATADQRSEFGVYALGSESNAGDELTDEQLAARLELRGLRDALLGWEETVSEHVVEPPTLYGGETMLVMARPSLEDIAAAGFPFDVVATGTVYENRVGTVFCAELVIADSPGLVDLVTADDAPATWDFEFRQSLPHEPGCDILPEQ